jgi:proteasome lid subunit RPN8/RPN11
MPQSDSIDVRLLRSESLPRGDFPAKRGADFRVYFAPAPHGRIVAHAKENVSVEICGVLVGDWGQDDDGPFARVTEIIRCDNATKKFAEVTFTHESWTQINREMDTQFSHLRIIGWYHSHPDFGIFLSDRDVFIQQNFFGGAGQIAFVVDPVRQAEGVFEWRDGKPVLAAHYWVGGRIVAGEPAARGTGSGHGSPAEAARNASGSAAGAAAAAGGLLDSGPSRWTSLTTMLLVMLCFLLGYLLAGQRSRWEQLRLVEGTVAHYGLWQGLRPGLEEGLAALRKELTVVSDRMDALSREHIRLSGDNAKEKTKEWNQLRESLTASRQLLKQLEDRYSLSPEEQAVLSKIVAQRMAELSASQPEPPAKKTSKDRNAEKPSVSEGSAGKADSEKGEKQSVPPKGESGDF